jgi:hypothetical protein
MTHFFGHWDHRFLVLRVRPDAMEEVVCEVEKDDGRYRRFEFCEARTEVPAGIAPVFYRLQQRLTMPGTTPSAVPAEHNSASNERQFQGAIEEFGARVPITAGVQPLVQIVDDRCCFASRRLEDAAGRPLVKSLWYLGDDPLTHERLPRPPRPGGQPATRLVFTSAVHVNAGSGDIDGGSPVGRVLTLDGMPNQALDDEVAAYEESQYLPVRPQWSHGSAVASVVARGARSLRGDGPPIPATLAFTQLPSPVVEDTTGGSLAALVLLAVDDALELAQRTKPEGAKAPRPTVVHLSYGTHGGPHDGTSLFEQALLERLRLHEHLHVVLPAGNSHRLRIQVGAEVRAGQERLFRWKVPPDNEGDAYLEIWLRPAALASLRVEAPDGSTLDGLRPGSASRLLDEQGRTCAAAIFPTELGEGDRSMVLLAVASTRGGADTGSAARESLKLPPRVNGPGQSGVWTVTVKADKVGDVRFDAWAQRDDSAPGRSRAFGGYTGRQSAFLEATEGGAVVPDGRVTLNGIATAEHPRLWVVGASRASDDGLSPYSASGPAGGLVSAENCGRRLEGPDVVVPGDESLARPGLLVGGLLGSSAVRVGGTSIAAALFTHHLVHELAIGRLPPASWCRSMPAPLALTTRTLVTEGSPAMAPPALRGEGQRLPAYAFGLEEGPQGRGLVP